MFTNPEIKEALVSILSCGNKSPLLNKFIRICCWLGLPVIRTSKYREHLQNKSGLCEKDIIIDVIGELFENSEGKFIIIENYVKKSIHSNFHSQIQPEKIHEDMLCSMLVTLIRSRVKQGISDMRNDFGEIYFNIKKALDIYLIRKSNVFKEITYLDDRIIYTCPDNDINFNLPFLSEDLLLETMFYKISKNNFVTELTRNIFAYLNGQNEYLKALKYNELLNILSEFYKKRLIDKGFIP